jgi:hypothetical protein
MVDRRTPSPDAIPTIYNAGDRTYPDAGDDLCLARIRPALRL